MYVNPPFNGTYYTNNNLCTWATCGGHALYETKNVQSVSSLNQSWGGDVSYFVSSSSPWFGRGGIADAGSDAGVFFSYSNIGWMTNSGGFRVALLVPVDAQELVLAKLPTSVSEAGSNYR